MNYKKQVQRKVTGYTAGLETLMWLIKKGETETSKFKWILDYYSLSEEKAWEIYEAWSQNQIHPDAVAVNKKVHGVE